MTPAIKVGESLMVSVRPGGKVRVCVRGNRLREFHAACRRAEVPAEIVARAAQAILGNTVLIEDIDGVDALAVGQHCAGALRASLLGQATTSLADHYRARAREYDELSARITLERIDDRPDGAA